MFAEDRRDNGIDNPAVTADDGSTLKPDLVISVQPKPNDSSRAELPVTNVNWRTNPRGQFIPVHGLDFLIGVTSLLIQQTVELDDLTSKVESENRYIVRVPHGEALYIASEVSSPTQRCLCGSGRGFLMHLHDSTRQEAMVLQRRLAAASCCFPCRLQEMKVITPPGDYVGRVVQQWSWVVPFYLVRDLNDQVLFAIEGPAVLQRSALMLSEFKIMTGDSLREVGKISHGWDRDLNSFATTIQVPNATVQPKHKALLLGAAFLLEYTYFMKSKRSCMRCCC
ncbi:phospholipid scramblase 2 [Amyelois transitella]|uniref:phospholipid scramblase 2 n=1 Tax=Amyelois transitella TaxID=680683 RepID=UPI0029904FE6|nr:phospholipid scramblase 2 [Amyelois transitella]